MHANGCQKTSGPHLQGPTFLAFFSESLGFSRSPLAADTGRFYYEKSSFYRLLLGYVGTAHTNSAILFSHLAYHSNHYSTLIIAQLLSSAFNSFSSPGCAMYPYYAPIIISFSKPKLFFMTHLFYFYFIYLLLIFLS